MISEDRLAATIGAYESDSDIVRAEGYRECGIDPLMPRLLRAALNQKSDRPAMVSRYAIWAETVRDNIIAALDVDEQKERHRLLTRAANSLSAFAEVQSLFDPDST